MKKQDKKNCACLTVLGGHLADGDMASDNLSRSTSVRACLVSLANREYDSAPAEAFFFLYCATVRAAAFAKGNAASLPAQHQHGPAGIVFLVRQIPPPFPSDLSAPLHSAPHTVDGAVLYSENCRC
jgi:hypothetical protein